MPPFAPAERDLDDATIVERVCRGDVDSFRLLIVRYEAQVHRLLRNLCHSQTAVEDLAQDVFLSAFLALRGFDAARGRFSSWLFCIAKHHGINAKKKHQPILVDDLAATPSLRTPADDLVCAQLERRLDATLRSLPDEQHSTFVLTEFLGLTPEEIAEIEGCTQSTIRSRLHRAKAALLAVIAQLEVIR